MHDHGGSIQPRLPPRKGNQGLSSQGRTPHLRSKLTRKWKIRRKVKMTSFLSTCNCTNQWKQVSRILLLLLVFTARPASERKNRFVFASKCVWAECMREKRGFWVLTNLGSEKWRVNVSGEVVLAVWCSLGRKGGVVIGLGGWWKGIMCHFVVIGRIGGKQGVNEGGFSYIVGKFPSLGLF